MIKPVLRKKNLINILNGWKNFMNKSEVIEMVAVSRGTHCIECKHAKHSKTIKAFVKDEFKEIEGFVCGLCDCPLSAKLRSENETCPLNKW